MGLSDLTKFEDPATWNLPAQQIDCLWVAGKQEHLMAICKARNGAACLFPSWWIEIDDDVV